MSKERELLNKAIEMIQIAPMMASIGNVPPDFGSELILEIQDLLAQPEPIKEREVLGKIISTDDACNWNLTVDALKDYDHVYVNGIRYTEYQPDINTQYLLDQVSRLTAENAMIKEKWLSQPEPFGPEERQRLSKAYSTRAEQVAFEEGIIFAEISYGIGVDDER